MHKFKCAVTPEDSLITYVSDMEVDHGDLFAVVCENLNEHRKVSVLLTKEDALILRDQLDEFIKG